MPLTALAEEMEKSAGIEGQTDNKQKSDSDTWNKILDKVSEAYKQIGYITPTNSEQMKDIDLLKGMLRTREEYYNRLFNKVMGILECLRSEDEEQKLFDPKLFETEKELMNLTLIITVMLTNPVSRQILRNRVDWDDFMKIREDSEE